MMQITEEMGEHEKWYDEAEAETMTMETLPAFLKKLSEEYKHDYGTICHAITAGGIATMHAMNRTPQGGITGFQASAIMWEFITHWMHEYKDMALKLLNYDDLLYPQTDYKFEKIISQGVWDDLREKAKKKLIESPEAHPNVLARWNDIADGILPNGFQIKKEG